jgi:Rad3-related DNA helicase
VTDELTPLECGLPRKFTEFRPGQLESAFDLVSSEKRFSLLAAPTGTGKSLIYMAVSRLLGARTLILVGTKGLQAQLMADFEQIGLADIRGQVNYRCLALDGDLADYGNPGAGCNDGPCHAGIFCSLKKAGCLYYDAQAWAKASNVVVSNYAYWLVIGRHSDPLAVGNFDLIILDEAHSAPDWLARFCAVDLDAGEVKLLLDLDLPPINEGVAVWAEWARGAAAIAREREEDARRQLRGLMFGRQRATRELLRLVSVGRELEELGKAYAWKRGEPSSREVHMPGMQTDWVAEKTPKGARFSPVWAHAYAEPYLFRHCPRVILSSATLSRDITKYLGIDRHQSDYHEVRSGFDPERRPFTYIPTTRVDRHSNEGQVRIWLRRIDTIIGDRLDRKGIIHTRSYARARTILERSRHRNLMIGHEPRSTRAAVARFKDADAPRVLVSPAVEEGFDFPGLECSYQIIAKVPFIDGRSPVVRARSKSDSGYLNYVAALSLVQQVGRGMRSADDLCETFIVDDHWKWFRKAVRFPTWFKKAWRQSRQPPAPLAVPPPAVQLAQQPRLGRRR